MRQALQRGDGEVEARGGELDADDGRAPEEELQGQPATAHAQLQDELPRAALGAICSIARVRPWLQQDLESSRNTAGQQLAVAKQLGAADPRRLGGIQHPSPAKARQAQGWQLKRLHRLIVGLGEALQHIPGHAARCWKRLVLLRCRRRGRRGRRGRRRREPSLKRAGAIGGGEGAEDVGARRQQGVDADLWAAPQVDAAVPRRRLATKGRHVVVGDGAAGRLQHSAEVGNAPIERTTADNAEA
mmetsp:Transcript_83109/g.269045  ORF Transcript_83109/g.269045 Transcript_83109/m.269045 type:complete len:244 (+) Transcript_83109:544-1275(+)